MMKSLYSIVFLGWTLSAGSVVAGEARLTPGVELPEIRTESLAKREVRLPAASAGKPAVVVFSFSKESGVPASQWMKRLTETYGTTGNTSFFNVIVLQSVPKFVRGMVTGSIRSQAPALIHDRMLTLYQDEAAWKQRLGVTDTKGVYVILVDTQGRIREQISGPFRDADFARIRAALEQHGPDAAR